MFVRINVWKILDDSDVNEFVIFIREISLYLKYQTSMMIDENSLLSLFYNDICGYFLGSCGSGKCCLVKKHKRKLSTDCDFSVTLNYDAHRKHINLLPKNNILFSASPHESVEYEDLACYFSDVVKVDSHTSQKVIKKLTELSCSWPLTIYKCHIEYDKLCLFLDKGRAFQNLLPYILSKGKLYGRSGICEEEVLVSTDQDQEDEWMINMTGYRVRLIGKVIKNLLIHLGYSVSQESSSATKKHYHVSSKSVVGGTSNDVIFCGAVIDVKKKCKERGTNLKDYLRQRCNELRTMSRHKHGAKVDSESWDDYFQKIGKATIQIDLVSVRPSRALNLNFQEDCHDTNRSASFILYNCARLAAIQEQFEKMSSENIYSPLIPVEEVDFSLLVKEDEWELLTSYLLMYPHVLQSTLEHLDDGKPMPNLICNFLYSLCGCYSSYYRRVRILTEPREQLLPVMFARIYLLKAIEVVLHNGLQLLDIEPVRYM